MSDNNLVALSHGRVILGATQQPELEHLRDKCIHELFEDQVQLAPEALAVTFGKHSLTYRELDRRASQLARHLQSLGVWPGAIVGLKVERSIEMVITLLGILKAGGVYWGLEEHLPEERRRQRLINARPSVIVARRAAVDEISRLVTSTGTTADAPPFDCMVAAIEDALEYHAEPSAVFPARRADAPAYLTYTSGSTGQPKGVLAPHRGVTRLVKGANYMSLTPQETLLHLSHLSFDASTFELWGALLNGGRVVLMPPGQPSPAEIGEAIRLHGITTLWLSAGLFHMMVDERLDDLKPLRQLLAGGDVLSPTHVIKARLALPDCRIVNGYGPTENTTFTCCYTVGDEWALTPSVPIGRPISHTQVYVLDAEMQPVPPGAMGELYVGGHGVACGYLNQPQLTAERFFPDPFSSLPGGRLYRTGDCVRSRADGNLEFLGRMDWQVKIRGYRVELGEIETALRAEPEIRDAVVTVREDTPGDRRLVAYLIAKGGEKPKDQDLGARLAQKLPNYMQPNAYIWLDQLPLTANGKVDREALPRLETPGDEAVVAGGQPVNLLELEVIRIWQALFHREGIARQDNFFALGGDSLLAARLVLEIEQRLDCSLPISALFQVPTVETLSQRLTQDNSAPPWGSLVPLQPKGARPPMFFMHGVRGDVFGFLELAGLLVPDQPVYGLQAVGLDGKSPRHTSVEAMAAHYVEEIRSFQPLGPYYLGGLSLGGLIAFEVAQQLRGLGQRVALLALLDTEPMGAMPWGLYMLTMASFVPRRMLFHLRRCWLLPLRDKVSYVSGRCEALLYWIRRNLSRSPGAGSNPLEPKEVAAGPEGEDYYVTAALAYRLQEYPGGADVFVSDDSDPSWIRTWTTLARGGVTFHKVPGLHLDFLRSKHAPDLAKALRDALDRAQKNELHS